MNNSNLNDLLKRYEHASPEEREEIRQLISSQTDEIFNRPDAELEDMDPHSAKKIFEDIVAAEASAKVIPIHKSRIVLRWAAAAIIVASAGLSTWLLMNDEAHRRLTFVNGGSEDTLITFYHSKSPFIRLPDGTTVLLNNDSELSYRRSYGESLREVTLTGEAYFDVKHNPAQPFIVSSGKVKTRVLGTAFNIKAYPDQPEVTVAVTRGKVQVSDGLHQEVIMPDEQVLVNQETEQFSKTPVSAVAVTGWTNRFLVLDNINYEEAAAIIADRYKVKVALANDDLKKCHITAIFINEETLDHILLVLNELHHTTSTRQKDGSILIDGKGCPASDTGE